jgi:hypothetical protein
MSVQQMLLGGGPSGYNLTNSLRFRASASAYLNRTPAVAGSRTTWTWSGWVKIGVISSNDNALFMALNNASGVYNVNDWSGVFLRAGSSFDFIVGNGGSVSGRLVTTQVFRDFSSWYHLVFTYDSTNATSTERMRMYVNGSRVTAFSTATYPSINTNSYQNTTNSHFICQSWLSGAPSNPFDGYLDEVNFIDGQALTPASFGSTNALTGVWQPAPYTGTYGTNGFYLPFTDNSALTTSSNVGLGRDYSGNGNFWTTNNISITAGVTYDSMTDVPTLTNATTANFAVLNPLVLTPNSTTFANGNLKFTGNAAGAHSISASSIAMPAGKWYAEFTLDNVGSPFSIVGLLGPNEPYQTMAYLGQTATSYGYDSGGRRTNNATVVTGYGATFTTGDIIALSFDTSTGTLIFYKNGVSQGTAYSGLTNTYFMGVDAYNGGSWTANFGQRPFAYTPPTGFVALNTFNLPTSTIVKGNTVMDATLYTGNGSTQTITNAAGFRPDLVWLKSRSNATDNELIDSVRGVTRSLISNSTAAEAIDTQGLTAFNSNGFTLGTDANYNGSARTFVGWQWQAGQGSSSSNTNGTITSTVSVNPTAGFSVVTYTGTGANATVGHGLGVAPRMVIVKIRSTLADWRVYHASTGATNVLYLNATNAATSSSTDWNNTAPTSSVFSIGTSGGVNNASSTYVAYCWSEIDGFSKFGSYVGNSNADGPFIYCGFEPKFVLFKGSSFANNWYIIDSTTNPINVAGAGLIPNANSAETATSTTENAVDFLSNGFKLRNNASAVAFNNSSGQTFIYAAFAENPFKNSLAR